MNINLQLPDWIEAWIEYMDNQESAIIYDNWVAVSMIASVLERKVYLQWDKRIYPNFYIVLVGPPGCRKGTAMDPGRSILDKLETINIAADASTREKLISRLKETSANFTDLSGDQYQHSSLTVFSEELTVFLGYGNQELMQNLADWYDCKKTWRYETKHQGVDNITGVWVNIIGATTPELLRESLPSESFGGGLNSRIIYAYADTISKLSIFPFLKQEEKNPLAELLLNDLQRINLLVGEFERGQSYLDRWAEWYPNQLNHPFTKDSKVAGYATRRPTHLHKLAMVMNASRGGDMKLSKVDFDRGLKLLTETERVMTKTFAGMGKSRLSIMMHRILEQIRAFKIVMHSELQKDFRFDTDEKELGSILATLEAANLINIERVQDEKGRDFKITYIGSERVGE